MIIFDQNMLDAYSNQDHVMQVMADEAQPGDRDFTSHCWLENSLPKRMIYQHMYVDLLRSGIRRLRVLDVGGGFTGLTRPMIANHDYFLLDIMAHDDHDRVRAIEESTGRKFWLNDDWHNWEPDGPFDLVVANDLFPNVDQRLGAFLEKYLPLAKEVRLSLTYYNQPRWYQVKRTDGEEIFHMIAFSGAQTAAALKPFVYVIQEPALQELEKDRSSLFPNGRQVCMVVLKKGAPS